MSKPKTKSTEHEESDTPPIELSEEAADLVRTLEAERDEAIAARQRALADYANYQRRASENERRALQSGAARLARSILPVLDHFDLALGQDPRKISTDQLIDGVKIVRDELARALAAHGVQAIAPQPNDEFDPNKHEAMMRQEANGVEPGRVVSVLQPGYAMDDHILRPAKVAIAPESAASQQDAAEEHSATENEE